MYKKILFAAILLSSHFAVLASQLPDYPFIHATGFAYGRFMPDVAEIAFEITASDVDPEAARVLAETRLMEIRDVLAQQGVSESDITIRSLKKDTKKADAGSDTAAMAVDLSCSVLIKVRDLSKWQAIMLPLLKMKNIDKLEASFDSSTRDKIELDLSAEAARDAQRKATGMAGAFGKRLGPVSAVSPGRLRSLASAFGLVTENAYTTESPRQAITLDLLMIPLLKLEASVDVVFRIK